MNTLCLGGIGAASGPFVVGATSDALGSLHTVSRPSTWLSRPKASQEPRLMLSSTISRWV